jgi:MFS transporter, DHA2 family, multidrug resistance protein
MAVLEARAAEGTRRWWAVGALALAMVVVGLDITVLSLALPTLAIDLHASTSQLQWISAAYSLVLAAALLPAGMLGDRFGRKKVLLGALALFGVASLACAYSGSAGMLIATRALLGLGAAAIVPLALAVLPVMFSEEERQRAVIVLMGTTIVAYPIGPILGGWLLTHFWWGSVFLINVPVAVIAAAAVALLMPESRSAERPKLDATGVAVSSAGMAAVTYGVIEAGQNGWGDVAALAWMLGGAMLLATFVYVERRVTRQGGQPLVDLGLFRSASFTWGTILQTIVSFALFGLVFTMPQYFQAIMGVNAMGSGARLLPLVGGLIVGGVIADRLVRLAGPRITIAIGFAVIAGGLFAGALTKVGSGYGSAVVWIMVLGAGLGLALPAAGNAALGALSAERSGVGTGLMMAVRTVGATFGVAILGSLLNSAYHSRLQLTGLPPAVVAAVRSSVFSGIAVARRLGSTPLLDSVRLAFVHGMDVMLWACGGIAVAGVVLALVFMPRQAGSAAAEPAEPGQGPAQAGSEHDRAA